MTNDINVLHFYKASLPHSIGGVEIFLDAHCKGTSRHGVKNAVLSLSKRPSKAPIQMDGYVVYQAKQNLYIASTGFSLSAFWQFKKLAQAADIIHYHFPYPFADLLHFACGIKKPSIVTYHSDIVKQKNLERIYGPLRKLFLNSVRHIVATSPNYLVSSHVLKSFHYKSSFIPIGIDINSYPKLNQNRVDFWRERLTTPFFLFIGAMRYYKGLHIALNAIKGTTIQLAIAGANGIEKELRHYAANHAIHNVKFLGLVSDEDKVALLNLCYGFVFPSHLRTEAFGISLLEAAAYGKPLISCEIGTGTSYVNIHNETGLVITPSSAEELRKAMQYLLDNPNKAAAMGENAKKRAHNLFTADKQAKAYCEHYQRLLTEKPVSPNTK